ncbi:protein kinase domain-containing protein [Pseudomonas mosselii]|uniref:protein kinase domain-containing protein n=1 Tax=Pseudomonas mosselii TaxID=78327 RepID=UPI00300C0E2A
MSEQPNAAHRLEGLVLNDGWIVGKRLSTGRDGGGTGGFFSVSYEANKDNQKAFLKAFDIVKALQIALDGGKPITLALQEQTQAFNFETAMHNICISAKMKRVVRVLAYGEADVPRLQNEQISRIPYMIMELATGGDVRQYIEKTEALDIALKLTYLKDVASGLLQLHNSKVAHQDLKPSNVMVFNEQIAKVGDLGRASSQAISALHDNYIIAGDRNYAPPEQLYMHPLTDWMDRRLRCDLYQFASIITFVFFGTTINYELKKRLPVDLHPACWGGSTSYTNALPFLTQSFEEIISDWRGTVPDWLNKDLIEIIKQCGNPDYTQRGSRKTLRQTVPALGLDRFISDLQRLILVSSMQAKRKTETGNTQQ